jgi:peptidoglycan/xylan/chitin deacetylase (PgdA/CDA1 family)
MIVSPWKYGKRWVYSITYDEALCELHRFAVPIHEEFGIPGHVEAVAGHLGVVRQLGQSSYNGFHHMGPAEMRDLIARGWGVGNHSWSHETITPAAVDRELGEAKAVLEEAIGQPVLLYCSPGNNVNMEPHVLAAARRFGYLGAMSITDALNRPGEELFWLNRTPLHEQYYEPFFSEYDPFRNLRHAQAEGGWIIDYCHCPLERAVHPNKDCTAPQLRRRFETVLSEGGDAVWCANPDEVIEYHVARRHARIERVAAAAGAEVYRLSLEGLPPQVGCRALTLEAEVPAAWCERPRVWVDGRPQPVELVRPRRLRVTVDARDGMEIRFQASDGRSRGDD